mmetsp:Transcript_21570/g.61999  ORF Transcript_21570/g.61999 Transcript_21570/m.61999 type:complete len:86 (-) Transcript_21570:42-299(-)
MRQAPLRTMHRSPGIFEGDLRKDPVTQVAADWLSAGRRRRPLRSLIGGRRVVKNKLPCFRVEKPTCEWSLMRASMPRLRSPTRDQ